MTDQPSSSKKPEGTGTDPWDLEHSDGTETKIHVPDDIREELEGNEVMLRRYQIFTRDFARIKRERELRERKNSGQQDSPETGDDDQFPHDDVENTAEVEKMLLGDRVKAAEDKFEAAQRELKAELESAARSEREARLQETFRQGGVRAQQSFTTPDPDLDFVRPAHKYGRMAHQPTPGQVSFRPRTSTPVEPVKRSVKIKPQNKNLVFKEGRDIERFLADYELAARVDGASEEDKCCQIINFIEGDELKVIIESLSGFIEGHWSCLKKELEELWGDSLEPFCTLADLIKLCEVARGEEKANYEDMGISTYAEYIRFQSKFRSMLTFLRSNHQMGQCDSILIASHYFQAFSPIIQEKAKEKMSQNGDIVKVSRVFQMPSLKVLEDTFRGVMEQRAAWENLGFQNRREIKKPEETMKTVAKLNSFQTTRQVNQATYLNMDNGAEAKLEEVKRKLDLANKEMEMLRRSVKSTSLASGSSYQPLSVIPASTITTSATTLRPLFNPDKGSTLCWYCGRNGHGTRSCLIGKTDIEAGKVSTDGNRWYLPDGSKLYTDRDAGEFYKTKVDEHYAKTTGKDPKEGSLEGTKAELKTNIGILSSWEPPSISSTRRVNFEVDVAKAKSGKAPTRSSPRFGREVIKEVVKEKPAQMEVIEEENSERFTTPSWDGPEEGSSVPTSTPKSSKGKSKIEDDINEEIVPTDAAGRKMSQEEVLQERLEWLKKTEGIGKKKPSAIPERKRSATGNQEMLDKLELMQSTAAKIRDKVTLNLSLAEMEVFAENFIFTALKGPEAVQKEFERRFGVVEEIQTEGVKEKEAVKKSGLSTNVIPQFTLLTREQIIEGIGSPEEQYFTLANALNPLYTTPLPFLSVVFNNDCQVLKALLDSGSTINLISERQARELGWVDQLKIRLALNGVTAHSAKLIGIVENVFIRLNKHIYGYQHFFVTDGDPPLILGGPFLSDFEVRIQYSDTKGIHLSLYDDRGLETIFKVASEDGRYLREIPADEWLEPHQKEPEERNRVFPQPQSSRRHHFPGCHTDRLADITTRNGLK